MCVTNTDKDCDLSQDRPILSSVSMPHDNNTAAALTTAEIWSWVSEGLNSKMNWPTDRQLQSNSDCCWLVT